MTTTAEPLDLNRPESAHRVGGALAASTGELVERIKLAPAALVTTADVDRAVGDRQAIGDAIRRVEEFFEPFVSLAHRLHKNLCDRRSEILKPLKALDAATAARLTEYKARVDRERDARERELAEQRRRDDQERAAVEAAALERQGEHAAAAAVIDTAIAAPEPVVVLPDPTKAVDGLNYRRVWKWRFVNDDEAVALASLLPRAFLKVDDTKINAHVRAFKSATKIPGIQVFYDDVPVR